MPDDVAAWFGDGLPFVVAVEADGRVLGWARVSSYSTGASTKASASTACTSTRGRRGRGLGRRLLDAIATAAEEAGFYKLTSRVFTTNAPSLAAHRAAGFYEVGVQLRHGRLDGTWKDCMLVERLLGPARSAVQDNERGRC